MTQHTRQQLGSYRLHRLLGQGGFAEVYLGYHRYLQTPVAIKILHHPLSSHAQQAFLLEAQTIARLLHPHIVRVLDFGIEECTPFLVMDYAPYGSFRERYQPGKPVPLEEIVPVVQQVAQALQYAHLAGCIHLDIKPENLLMGWHHQVWLSDFGFALPILPTSQPVMVGLGGTLDYAAPEQLRGQPVPASDQYALGVVVYEWLSGQTPFVGSSLELTTQHLLASPPPLRRHLPTLPGAVEEVVLTALAKDPEQRFPGVAAFADALSRVSQRAPSSSWPVEVRASAARRAAAAELAHLPRELSPQNRRSLLPAAQAVSGKRATRGRTVARAHPSSPSSMLPPRHDLLPLTRQGQAAPGSQQEASFRKLPPPIAPSVSPPRRAARERLMVGLVLLIMLCIGTLPASLGWSQPGAGRTSDSLTQANRAAISPTTPIITPIPSPSAPAGPAATPPPSPSPSLPTLRFDVTPSRFEDQCSTHKATLPPKTLLLDNTRSTVPVTWKVQIITSDQTGHLWATANPASGSIPAGQHATLLLLPASKLCQHTKGVVTYQALLTYQGEDLAGTLSLTDRVTEP